MMKSPSDREHHAPVLVVLAILALSGLSGCQQDSGGSRCVVGLEETLQSSGVLPLDRDPYGLEERIYEDQTFSPAKGIVIDPQPLSRGLHPVMRFWQDPATCEAVGGTYPWAAEPPPAVEGETSFPIAALPAVGSIGNIRALLVIGPDEGAREDFEIWYEALETLLATGMILTEPTRAQVEEGLEFVCQGVGQDEAVILITTGRGSPAEGGALLLKDDALSYPRLAVQLTQLCGDAGLRIWALDAPWSHDIDSYLTSAEPFILWRASDDARPDAPRIAPGRGGLLSAALARTVAERARQTCVNKRDVFLQELAWIFRDDGQVSNRMTQIRWEATTSLTDPDAYTPLRSPRVVQQQRVLALTGDIPRQISRIEGMDIGLACESDIECRLTTSNCEAGPCLVWGCVDGRCAPRPDEGLPCDDGSTCTRLDTCDAIGICTGSPVDCGDGEPCTIDTCFWDVGCVSRERDTGDRCDDLNDCTTGDECDEAGLCIGEDKDCADSNPCTLDSCDPDEGCVNEVAQLPCDDGDPCTHQDYCHDGICSGQVLPCIDGDPCTLDACSPEQGCVFPPMPDGTPCDDSDPCTGQDACAGGSCTGAAQECDDDIPCTIDLCQEGGCTNLSPPGTCATAAGCVDVGEHPVDEPCLVCASTNLLQPDLTLNGSPCPDDGAPCTLDQCDSGVCAHPLSPDACQDAEGACVATGDQVAPCLECLGGGATGPASIGDICDDGDPCTVDGVCDEQGICGGSTLPCCVLHTDLSCEFTVGGTLYEGQGTSLLDTWSCSAALAMITSEGIHPFEAPCDGVYNFELTGPTGALLFVVEADPDELLGDTCAQGLCNTYTAQTTNLLMTEGEWVYLVVDGLASSDGSYELVTTCPVCEDP